MKVFGNIIWHFPFFGFVSATITYLLGLLLTITVVAAPIGLGLMELGKLLFWPFGNTMVKQSDVSAVPNSAWNTYSKILMLFYLPLGIVLVVLGAIQVGLLFLSIMGIPAAMVLAKSLSTYLNPVGKKCVSSAMAEELERRKAQRELDGVPPAVAPASVVTEQVTPSINTDKLQEAVRDLANKPKVVGYGAAALGVIVAVVVVFKLVGGDSQRSVADNQVKKELAREIFRDDMPKTPAVDNAAIEAKAAADKAAKEKALADQALAEKLASEKTKADAEAKVSADKALADKLDAEKLAAEKLAAAQQEEAKKKAAASTAAAKSPAPTTTVHQPSSSPTNPPKNPNSAIVDGMVKDGAECLAAKRFDCAITQAKSALRVDPASSTAKSLLQKAKAGQQAAMDSIEIR
ncbi:MAG: hypothetical protein RIR18_773 [Pseudomonadota bacterium]|jgi:uncharacterized membrane protein YccF (DUF307 family)